MTEKSKKTLGLIYLDRSYFAYFAANLPNIARFDLPPNIVKDLEILNKTELEIQLNLFVKQIKINPSLLHIVLSDNICFSKDFPQTTSEQQDTLFQNFLNIIPFENVSSKIYKIDRGFRIVSANREFYENIIEIFNRLGFTTVAVAPASSLGITASNFDLAVARYILEKHDLVKQQSFLLPQPIVHKTHLPEKKVFGVRRVLVLLLFFSILLSFLLYLIYKQATELTTVSKPKRKTVIYINSDKYIKLALDKQYST